ncbi:PREDICTED: uncharacterized protein LOC101310237 [Fragaria vesca subsp. vesca]|uniref:uncharacterized protein LOC101310237 n=1 Tax=Fragaria vesca subsp. vesca TaxID=101020 RepID=UPI0002C34B03|nr:PREDICTED: uncharacterized protein LOC101310237 [Fragaria vesca subsp. vesca]
MAKKRQIELVRNPLHKRSTTSGLIDILNSDNDPDSQDSWVIVKKQRVNILLPVLPGANKPPLPSLEPSQLQLVARETVESESQLPINTHPKTASVYEKKKIKPVARKVVELAKKASPAAEYVPTFSQSMRRDIRTNSRIPDQMATSQYQRALGVSITSKAMMQQRKLQHVFLDQGLLVNQRLRARNLARKLQNAGGLSRWLASLGLEQFVKIFQRKGFSKFHLVNLNMKKLKDMGANAVGPRRKLMHAIECFCQPSYY